MRTHSQVVIYSLVYRGECGRQESIAFDEMLCAVQIFTDFSNVIGPSYVIGRANI